MNLSFFAVYHLPMRLHLFGVVCGAIMIVTRSYAQQDTLTSAPWLQHEFRYWRGVPPMHVHETTEQGEVDTEVMGYTDEDRRMSFFRDHRYQEVVFEDDGFVTARIWQPGDCPELKGDTVAVLTGSWNWASDTLHVIVERTAHYPLDAVLDVYVRRDMSRPFAVQQPPSRVCNTDRDRKFWFANGKLMEAVRRWD